MQIPIVRQFRDDILHKNPENQIRQEPFDTITPGEGTRIIVPKQSPFFTTSLRLFFKNGQEMTEEHFEIYQIMPGLTNLAAQGVACMILLKDPAITEGFLDYDVVGEFTLFDTSLMNLVLSTENDDRLIDFEKIRGKPVVFPPKLHGQSLLYDIVAFDDTIRVLGLISEFSNRKGKPLIQTKIERYFSTFSSYLEMYKDMLLKYLSDHSNSYNSHGIKASQVNLGNVDNFATAVGTADLLSGRNDLHLTVEGLRTIVELTGADANEFLARDTLPISQFGNSNFIPPSIDGSFEGLGGLSETAGVAMESDGSVVFLDNRYDGRVDGLYFSVMADPYSPDRKKVYTAYRYTHQRIENDGATVNRIASGSGAEAILMADTDKNFLYIGLTNGSLDPAKHVLSRIDMTPLMSQLPTGQRACDHIAWMQVMLMGDWVYVSFAHSYNGRANLSNIPGERRFRYYYKIPRADIGSVSVVTPVAQRLSFVDSDGVNRSNAQYFRLYTPVGTFPNLTKCYFPIRQTTGTVIYGNCYAQHCLTVAHPTKPGIFVMKIIGAFLGSHASASSSLQFQTQIEMTYEIDPETGVMTLLHKTPQPTLDFTNPFIDWLNPPDNWRTLPQMVYAWDQQGMDVLPDGTIMCGMGDYMSFPRGHYMLKPRNFKTRYETLSKQWNTSLGPLDVEEKKYEGIISPLKSGVKPKSFLLGNKGDFYTADIGVAGAKNKLFYRESTAGLALRPDIQNKLISNVRSRPLSNKVWEVRGDPRIGGATVTVPSSQLATFGTDLGDFRFCVGTQRKYLDLPNQSAEWTQPTDMNSIKLISGHNTRVNTQGLLEIIPTVTITYPSAIVDQLKQQVDNPTQMARSPDVVVVICDPTGPLTDKFGWLPVLVWISWGRIGTTERHDTFMSITPTYSGGTTKTVTGFTVLDRIHMVTPTGAVELSATKWDCSISGDTNYPAHGSPRVGYYLNGNQLTGFFDSGVGASGQGDRLQMYSQFRYANRASSKRWSTSTSPYTNTYIDIGNAGGNAHRAVTPDNGVSIMAMHNVSAGGAATIFKGDSYNAMLGSVYPETGWTIFFQLENKATFNGKQYIIPSGTIDLRDVDSDPGNKTFYIYAVLVSGEPEYQVTQEKRLETPFQVWVAKVVTNASQIITVERFNVFTINGSRISEIKRGNSIPASSGLVNVEGQLPWLRSGEMLP